MEITATTEQAKVPVTVLHLTGDLDADTSRSWWSKLALWLPKASITSSSTCPRCATSAAPACGRCTRCTWCWPEGEQKTMLEGVRDGTYSSADLRLLRPNSNVTTVLSLTGIDMYLQVFADLQSALASF